MRRKEEGQGGKKRKEERGLSNGAKRNLGGKPTRGKFRGGCGQGISKSYRPNQCPPLPHPGSSVIYGTYSSFLVNGVLKKKEKKLCSLSGSA